MTQQPLMQTALALTASMEAAAALAALARVETEGIEIDERIRELLNAVADEVGVGGIDRNDPGAPAVIGMTRTLLSQSTELVDNPGRRAGWEQVDPAMLQGVGRMSASIVDAYRAAATALPALGERLQAPDARFLDVGTGTAWLAMATAKAYPGLHVTGIDIFEPALTLARGNVTAAGMNERVTLLHRDATTLDTSDAFDIIWLPLPFLPLDVLPDIIDACRAALRPGGWLLPGTFAGRGDRLAELLSDLRTVRAGGHQWRPAELLDLLGHHGFPNAVHVERTWAAPVHLYAGTR